MPLEVVLIVGERGERRPALAAGEGRIESVQPEEVVERAHFGQRQNVRLQPAQRVRRRIIEHVVGELVGRIELAARDRLERRKVVLGGGLLRRIISVADIVPQPVGVAHVAAQERFERVAPEVPLIALLEQLEQPVMGAELCGFGGRELHQPDPGARGD